MAGFQAVRSHIVRTLQRRLRTVHAGRDKGASAVEYGLLVALIAVVIAATVYALGTALSSRFSTSKRCVDNIGNSATTCTPGGGGGGGGGG
jgi:pilus assembly protein Flp/PilA